MTTAMKYCVALLLLSGPVVEGARAQMRRRNATGLNANATTALRATANATMALRANATGLSANATTALRATANATTALRANATGSATSHSAAPNMPWETEARYGSSYCPCIGIDNLEGTTEVSYKGQKMTYPADVGGRCKDWDLGIAPECVSAGPAGYDYAPEWCKQQWCYVDPCNCRLDVPPKQSAYMSDAMTKGRPIHYSYATCGGVDHWSTDEMKAKAQKADNEALCEQKPDPSKWGNEKCKCIGIEGQEGETKMNYLGKSFSYPADVGSYCSDWEWHHHPECQNSVPAPGWCYSKWCYVDINSCEIGEPPKPSDFLAGALYQGVRLHYSYHTCGSSDMWTFDTPKARTEDNFHPIRAQHVPEAPDIITWKEREAAEPQYNYTKYGKDWRMEYGKNAWDKR